MRSETLRAFEETIRFGGSAAEIESWADKKSSLHAKLDASKEPPEGFDSFTIWDVRGMNGYERFISMALLADWMCYAPPTYSLPDRCSYVRMNRVIRGFEDGFRLFSCRLADGSLIPVGYTGWYPIDEKVFSLLETAPEKLTDRGQMKSLPCVEENGSYLYLFNFSVIPCLKGTEQARNLLERYKKDLDAQPKRGLASVTVSPDGQRVSKRFGMRRAGQMTHEGEAEDVFVRRFEEPTKAFRLHPKQKLKPV